MKIDSSVSAVVTSIVQVALQPSPLTALPSSHCSIELGSKRPFPQAAAEYEVMRSSYAVSVAFNPSSHTTASVWRRNVQRSRGELHRDCGSEHQ